MAENRGDRIRRFENYEQLAGIVGVFSGGAALLGLALAIAGLSGIETINKDGSIMPAEDIRNLGLLTVISAGAVSVISFALSAKFKKISTDSLHYKPD